MELNKDCFLLRTFDVTAQEASINRYSRDTMIQKETLLEHVGWVATWSYLIAQDLQKETSIEIDYGSLLTKAIIHDIDEVGTGDLPRTTKYASRAVLKALKKVEDTSVKWLLKDLELEGTNFYEDWKNAKSPDTLEGVIVKLADMASVVYKVWHEVLRLGNNSFSRVAKEIQIDLNNVKDKYSKQDESCSYLPYLMGLVDDMIAIVDLAVNYTENIQDIVAAPIDISEDLDE